MTLSEFALPSAPPVRLREAVINPLNNFTLTFAVAGAEILGTSGVLFLTGAILVCLSTLSLML